MSDIAIQVDNLSKRYRIGRGLEGRSTYGSLRETLADAASAPIRRLRRSNNGDSKSETDFIWALKDVSFEVKKGEVVGIIGRNGAGKTTLLKVLSRITSPTKGNVRLWGRVGSLLEVGTGFHPELTGRENIYLNGAVLGMQRVEIERKFDEIVDFAEIEQFLDTPVKRYSSGMYMRLAFAVAAHLEPEILLVDEVLAVGDAAFQKKCLGKMGEVAKEGRTVIFVSHQLGAVRTLCNKGIYINQGKIHARGSIINVLDEYQKLSYTDLESLAEITFQENQYLPAQILSATILDNKGEPSESFNVFDDITLQIQYQVRSNITGYAMIIILKLNSEILLISFDTDTKPDLLLSRVIGKYTASIEIPPILKKGKYSLDLSIGKLFSSSLDFHENALSFNILENSTNPRNKSFSSIRSGLIATNLFWKTIKE